MKLAPAAALVFALVPGPPPAAAPLGGADLVLAEQRVDVPGAATDVVVADWNGDGRDDVAVCTTAGRIHLHFSTPTGALEPAEPLWVGSGLGSLVTTDLDLDGELDLAVTVPGDDAVAVFGAAGGGAFVGPTSFPAGTLPTRLAAGDVDGDGRPDLAAANPTTDAVSVLLGVDGGFLAPTAEPFPGRPVDVRLADLEGDGDLDLVVALDTGEAVAVALGLGNGAFLDPKTHPSSGPLRAVALGDLTGDGVLDAVAGGAEGLTFHEGRGNGSFDPQQVVSTLPFLQLVPDEVEDLRIVDVDGDGTPDIALVDRPLAVTSSAFDRVLVLRGAAAPPYDVLEHARLANGEGAGLTALATGDLLGTGDTDTVATLGGPGALFVLRGPGDAVLGTPAAGPGSTLQRALDLDGDGAEELLDFGVGELAQPVRVLEPDGAGGYVEAFSSSAVPHRADDLAAADFDGDGEVDVVTTSSFFSASKLHFLAGGGDGTFAPPVEVQVLESQRLGAIEAGDLDADGSLDLVAISPLLDSLGVLYGDGAGGFGSPFWTPLGEQPADLAVADLDQDGALDVLVTLASNASLRFLPGTGLAGAGAFGAPLDTPLPDKPKPLALADVDGDGALDALVGLATPQLAVLQGLGDGSFGSLATHPLAFASAAAGLTLGDADGDGGLDVVVTENAAGSFAVLRGDGGASFQPALLSFQAQGADADCVVVTDADGDGRPELVQNGTYVHANLALAPPTLTAEPAALSLAAGGTQTFQLCAGPEHAGALYALLGTTAGVSPGIPLGPVTLPLNFSSYLVTTITSGAFLVDPTGFLDEAGAATAANELPPGLPAGLAGVTVHHAYLVLDPGPPAVPLFASAAVALELLP